MPGDSDFCLCSSCGATLNPYTRRWCDKVYCAKCLANVQRRCLILADWERNGYDDSDFFYALYDQENDQIVGHMYRSTRFAGGDGCSFSNVTSVEQVEAARKCLARQLASTLAALDKVRVESLTRDALAAGDEVMLAKACQHRVQKLVTTPCERCEGAGTWVSPRDQRDIRKCFACKGSGETSKKDGFERDGRLRARRER